MTENHILETQSLSCERGNRLLFSDLDFTLKSGEGLHIVGANGSGKTSLLRTLTHLSTPENGRILWNKTDIGQLKHQYASLFCFIGHKTGVNAQLSARENCDFLMKIRNQKCSLNEIDTALGQVELLGFEDEASSTLSAGQQRRIALAQLLLTKAPLWLLDEPYTALDQRGIEILDKIFTQHLEHKGLLIFASHQDSSLDQASNIKKIHLEN